MFCECSEQCSNAVGTLIVAFVGLIIGMITLGGIYPILWDLCQQPMSFFAALCASLTLLGNILFNYSMAVGRSSDVQQFYDIVQQPPAQQALNDFTFCMRCAAAPCPLTMLLCLGGHY